MSKRRMHPLAHGSRLAAVPGQPRRAEASIHSLDEACATLASRLGERLPELEATLTTRVYAIADPREVADPTYLHIRG